MIELQAIKEVKRWTSILMSAGSKCLSETAEAQDMAIKALEKRIPKKIKIIEEVNIKGMKEYFAICPNCDNGNRFCVGIGEFEKPSLKSWENEYYCRNCGQKLDWND